MKNRTYVNAVNGSVSCDFANAPLVFHSHKISEPSTGRFCVISYPSQYLDEKRAIRYLLSLSPGERIADLLGCNPDVRDTLRAAHISTTSGSLLDVYSIQDILDANEEDLCELYSDLIYEWDLCEMP